MQENNTSNKKTGIIIIVACFIIAIIAVIGFAIYSAQSRPDFISIKNLNEYLPSAFNDDKKSLEQDLYLISTSNIDNFESDETISATIRDGSFKEESITDDINRSTFLVDIDYLKQTYFITFDWSKQSHVPNGIVIDCPNLNETKYPESNCIGMYNSTASLKAEANAPISKILPIVVEDINKDPKSYNHYEIRGYFDEKDNYKYIINIMDYTGGNYENGLQAIRDAGFNPEEYTINYRDWTVYQYLPYEGTNSLGDKYTLNYTTTQNGQPYFLINNYSCGNKERSEAATISSVADWFLARGNSLNYYDYGIITFCPSIMY